jgi:hypothetical protein
VAGSPLAVLSYRWETGTTIPIALDTNGGFDQALDFTGIADGNHMLTLRGVDAAGNVRNVWVQGNTR